MYLIILLSVTLWRLFGGCYLFVVETPRGSMQPIRDCCSVNSPLTSPGWAWLLFKWASFCIGPELKPPRDWFPRERFNGITVRSAPRRVVTLWSCWSCWGGGGVGLSVPSEAEGGRERKTVPGKKRWTVVSCVTFRKMRMVKWTTPLCP